MNSFNTNAYTRENKTPQREREQASTKEKVEEKSRKHAKPTIIPRQEPRVTEKSEITPETDRDQKILRPRAVTKYDETKRRTVREKKQKASSNQPQTNPKKPQQRESGGDHRKVIKRNARSQ